MKARSLLLLAFLLAGFDSFAQTDTSAKTKPEFSFGPRIGIGQSKFIGTPAICEPSISVNAAITASWQFKRFFGVEFSPAATIYNGKLKRSTRDGVDNLGNPMVYSYKEIFNIYSVEFPAMAEFCIKRKNISLHGFFGPGIGFNMGGTHSKVYNDETYNSHNGIYGHPIYDLKDSFYLCAAGAGIKFKTHNGFVGFDFRMQRTSAIAGVDGIKFSAQNATIGISWQLTSSENDQVSQ